jgi:hypothetical protein
MSRMPSLTLSFSQNLKNSGIEEFDRDTFLQFSCRLWLPRRQRKGFETAFDEEKL